MDTFHSIYALNTGSGVCGAMKPSSLQWRAPLGGDEHKLTPIVEACGTLSLSYQHSMFPVETDVEEGVRRKDN